MPLLQPTHYCVALGLLCLLLPSCVRSDAMYFQPTNIQQPSLYQTMELRFLGWSSLDGDRTVQTGDFVYIISSTATSCSVTAPSSSNNFPITANTAQNAATVTITVSPTVFTAGSSYSACYVSTASSSQAFVVQRMTFSSGSLVVVSFTVLSAIYQSQVITPATVYAGQGLITIVITETNQTTNGRPMNQGGVGGLRPFFFACGANCGDYATLASLCSAASSTTGVIFSSIDGYTTTTLTGTFTAPLSPSSTGYAVCVPYCYSSSAGCSADAYTMPWTVVTVSAVIFLAANPSSYSFDPLSPTVRMSASANLTGTGLTANDRVKILTNGSSCSSSSAALLSNVNYNQAVTLLNSTATAMAFSSLALISASITGQLCYALGANPTIFAPVFQSGSSVSDFVVNPMQPTALVTSPTTPTLGQSFSVTFTGTSLSATTDLAYLVTSSSSSCTVTSSSDLCDGTTTNPSYACTLTGTTSPACTVTVDPTTNSAATLCACYRVPRSRNYGMVNGSISLSARNPIYTISPYPVYEGQQATITFTGSGISVADTIRFVASTDVCTGTAITNVTAYSGSSNVTTSSAFSLVGPGSLCMRVCYQFTGTSTWVISRPTSSISVVASCDATQLYISPFALQYTLAPTSMVAYGTTTATFTAAATPAAFMVVPATSATCVITNCGTGPACAQSALAADYFSAISSQVGTFGITRTGSQVLCVSLGSSYIPVQQTTSSSYLFTSGTQNPAAVATTPASWRVSMSNLTATFTGTSLNSTNDILRVVSNTTLLSTKGVCPQEAASVTALLTATAASSTDPTTTSFALRGADTLISGTNAYFCYYRGVAGSRVADYVGSIAIQPQNPASMTATGTLRAGEVVSILFSAATGASLNPSADSLTFFQYQQSSIAPTCRCDAVTCATAVSNTTTSIVMTGSSSASTWRNPTGFNNLASNAIYVVCYNVATSGSPTYVGQLSISQSNPSYYTLGSTSVRVGLPIVITVTTLCSTCTSLNASDSIIIVQNSSNCADVSAMNASQAEAVTAVTFTSPNTQRTLVPLLMGNYRVCYKKVADTVFSELAFSSSFSSAALVVAQADPAAFAPVPANPTAGQYMIVNLTTCSATVCATCSAIRVLAGVGASCWNAALTGYSSTSCVGTSTVYQFPNQYFTAGSYTVCFGDSGVTSSRIPGTLVIAAANPAYYTAASTSIFVNQGSKATITMVGTSLQAADKTFLLPNFTYSCHDLRDSSLDIISDATYAGWWAPSVNAYAITVNSTSLVQWVASDSSNRFTADIIASSKFCSNVGVNCGLQLCYLRSGQSWAPVNMQTNTRMTLFPANPQTVVFDVSGTPRVTQYVLATVTGTGLLTTDVLYFADGFCDTGTVVAITVSVATTNGTTWIAVVRFTGRNAGTVTACYTSGVTTTQILNAPTILTIGAPLYYMKQPLFNQTLPTGAATHVMTQYESVYIAGTTSTTGASAIVNVVLMYLVNQADECNYPTYPAMVFTVQMSFDRVDGQTSYFVGRLYKSGSFALCVNTSGLLFRIVGSATNNSATALTVLTPNPTSYTVIPTTPFVNQAFTVSFQFASGSSFETQNVTGDAVSLINGSLQSCGFANTSSTILPLNSSGVGALIMPSANTTANLTLCYDTYNGSAATIPRFGLVDRNFAFAAPYPRYFSTVPLTPQRTVSLNITFYSNGTGPLSTADRAYLVYITNTSTGPQSSDCNQTAALSATAITVSGTTSRWAISAATNTIAAGNYSVCYIVASNGKGAIVDLSGYLVLVERESPFGIVTDSVGGLSIYNGERVHIYFLSNVTLNPALSWLANATQDSVIFSSVSTCATALTTGQVDAIPDSFLYNNTSTHTQSFVHVRFRLAGTYYVCMRRVGRTPLQQYYNYDTVGGPDAPIAIVVSPSPMLTTTLLPATPRVAVPNSVLVPTYTSGFTAASFATIFAAPYANTTNGDSLINDPCYYPPAAVALGTLVVNTTLMFFTSNVTAQYPFPTAGLYKLCYALPSRNIASLPVPFTVGNMSPINYAVPDLIAPGTTFTMSFTAIDAIFASSGNIATVVAYTATSGIPSCVGVTAATGTSNFSTFTGNQTVSSVQPLLTSQGTYYVCFRTFDQIQYFPVLNVLGGYTFGVGNVGPASYTVSPTPRYAGQLLTLSINGNALRAADTAKVVNVTGLTASNATYFALCSSTSPVATDSNGLSSNTALGSNVTLTSTNFVTLSARIMASGVFILCYRGATNAWAYVPDVMSFTVNGPIPSLYITSPLVPYVTQITTLSLRSPAGGLSTADSFKIVLRGSSSNGFDCDTFTVAALAYTFTSSSATERNVTFCNQTAASFSVCYLLSGGTWAEVPSWTGAYAPLVIAAVPLSVSSLTISSSPRPLEQYTLLLGTTSTGSGLTTVNSVQYVTNASYVACAANTMTAPLFSVITGLSAKAEMQATNQYRILVGLNAGDPLITLTALLPIVPCDPCTFTPVVMFSAATYTMTFTSSTSSFASTDSVRIVPSSLGLAVPDVCVSTTGSFGSLTFSPSTSTLQQTTIVVTAPSTSAGSYYVCYRKNTTTDYAVIGSSLGAPQLLQVINAVPQAFTVCPTALFGGEGASFNFTTTQPVLAPLTSSDSVFMVDSSSPCTATTTTTYPLTFGVNGTGYGVFDLVLPSVTTSTTFRVCYQHRLDTIYRSIGTVVVAAQNPASFTTQPANISVGLSNGNVTLVGTALASADQVYFVSNGTSCEEYCRTSPVTLASVGPSFSIDTTGLPTSVTVRLNGSFTTTGTVSICYRRSGGTLAKLPQSLVIAPANPTSYTTNFATRFRTRPLFNFTGTSLGATDIVKVIAEGSACATTSGIATGTFSTSSTSGAWSAFLIPLDEPMYIGTFTVCYNLGGSGGWVPVAPQLQVLPGGPLAFATTNVPMEGRAIDTSFPAQNFASYFGLGDQVRLVCATCSCWTSAATSVAYGSAELTVASTATPTVLRFGVSTPQTVLVCYRVADSGFGLVAAMSIITAFPTTVAHFPAPPLRGQRISLTVSGNYSLYSSNDQVMIASPSRGCWDNVITNPIAVFSIGNLSTVSTAQGTGVVQIPSLGPSVATFAFTFPLDVTICFRQAGQPEFVFVPFPALDNFTVLPSNPAALSSTPSIVREGMINVSLTFSTSPVTSADSAFVVTGDWGDRICDASSTIAVGSSTVSSAQNLTFTALRVDTGVLQGRNITACVIKANGTVAEVPQQIVVADRNPSYYTLNTTSPRNREYVLLTLQGTGLTTSIGLVLSSIPCFYGALDATTAVSGRASDGSGNATNVAFVVQLLGPANTFTAYVCVFYGGAWSELGNFAVAQAVPSILTTSPAAPRGGQHVIVSLTFPSAYALTSAAVLWTTGSQSWCTNFTSAAEPSLLIDSTNQRLSSNVWLPYGTVRVCIYSNTFQLWRDVDDALYDLSSVVILPPSPSSMWTYPLVPRVGQQVTVYFTLLVAPQAGDRVVLLNRTASGMNTIACDDASVTGQTQLSLSSFNSTIASVVVLDPTDVLLYRSFSVVQSVRTCYYSATENTWNAAGGTVASSSFAVADLSPFKWQLVSGQLVVQKPSVIGFTGLASTLGALDSAYLVPLGSSCANRTCSSCMDIALNSATLNATFIASQPFSPQLDGNFSVCYVLTDATAAMVPGTMSIATGDIQCVEQAEVQIGLRQNLTFRVLPNVNTSADTFQISVWGSSTGLCNASTLPDFPVARAAQVAATSTSVTYSLEWPVTLNSSRYTICYKHLGESGRVCACSQFDARVSDCFVTTTPAVPGPFTTFPEPTYVGQLIAVTMSQPTTVAVVDVVLVVYAATNLSTCRNTAASVFLSSSFTQRLSTSTTFQFKHDYRTGANRFLVCALLSGATDYARVPTYEDGLGTLNIRSYLQLTTLPSVLAYIRAHVTLQLTTAHTSLLSDDVVSPSDSITFVQDPLTCNESFVDGNTTHSAEVMAAIQSADSTIKSNGISTVGSATNTTTVSYVTFAGVGSWYLCYRLSGTTWAVVNRQLAILAAAWDGCTTTPTASPANSDAGALRAFQYFPVSLQGSSAVFLTVQTSSDDMYLVRSTDACYNQSAAIFAPSRPFIFPTTYPTAVGWSPYSGSVKLCYRIGGSTNTSVFSPVCNISLNTGTPTGVANTCLLAGETMSMTTTTVSPIVFSTSDIVWFTSGADCYYSNTTVAAASSQYFLNYSATQTTFQPTVSSTSAVFSPVTSADSARLLRMCYRNAIGSYFSIPLNSNVDGTIVITLRQPAASVLPPFRVQVGQIPSVYFIARNGTPALLGGNITIPPMLSAISTIDSAGVAAKLSAISEGSCSYYNPPMYQVNQLNTSATNGALVLTSSGTHTSCYRLAQCTITDVPTSFRVFEANPASMGLQPTPARKGQLLNITFTRATNESDALFLTPGGDRGVAIDTSVQACWQLSASSGLLVSGTPLVTWVQSIIYADPPTQPTSVVAMGCYLLVASPIWSAVPNSQNIIYPANPRYFQTPTTPMAYTEVQITFIGANFSSGDRAKIIPLSLNCSETSVPPTTLTAFGTDLTQTTLAGTSSGWYVYNVNQNTSVLNITSNASGTFSVCYRLATDTVWTLVYSNLVIQPRNPELAVITPTSALESEIFTVAFSRSNYSFDPSLEMAVTDRLELVNGADANCMITRSEDIISTGPSRTDLLPNYTFFQMASATRGLFTLCYARWVNGVRIPTWGFPTVTILPNPTTFFTHTASPAINQYIGIVFQGFGLQSISGRVDSVKLLASTAAQTDLACRTVDQVSSVLMGDFRAFGNYSIQTVVALTAQTVWVCYKLYGGQYHVMPSSLTFASASMTQSQALKTSATDGEQLALSIGFLTTGYRQGDYAFLSTVNCSDILVALTPATDSVTSFAVSTNLTQDTSGVMHGSLRPAAAGIYSVCYRSPQNPIGGVTTILQWSITVGQGIPAAFNTSLPFVAQRFLTIAIPWNASDAPAGSYLTLVRLTTDCVGQTQPASAVYAQSVSWNTTYVSITAVLPSSGMYYLCSSRPIAPCGVGTVECARVVGTLTSSAAVPLGWASTPAAASFAPLEFTRFQFYTSDVPSTATSVYLSYMSTTTPLTSATILPCVNTSATAVALTANTVANVNVYEGYLPAPGSFVVCVAIANTVAVFPSQYLTAVPSTLISITPTPASPFVTDTFILEAIGTGLSSNDTLRLVQLPLQSTYSAATLLAACSNSALVYVTATAEDVVTAVSSQYFSASTLISANYASCYRFSYSSTTWQTGSVVVVSPRITSVIVSSQPVYTLTPFSMTLNGISLSNGDQVGFALSSRGCFLDSISYFTVTNVNSTLTVATGLTISTAATYVACFKAAVGTVQQLTPLIVVATRQVIAAQFVVQPICSEYVVCSQQPSVVTLDAGGNMLGEIGSTISLTLQSTDGTNRNDALFGNGTYSFLSTGRFDFYTVTIRAAGSYRMTATVLLLGGATLVATSGVIVVPTNTSLRTLSLACTPTLLLRGSTPGTITCTIFATTNNTASTFAISSSAGTISSTVRTYVGGLPVYIFSVDVSMTNYTLNFVIISVAAADPNYPGRVVDNSPAIVRIASAPDNTSLLICATNVTFNGTRYVRAVGSVSCALQGRVLVGGVVYDIIAPSSYFTVTGSVDGVASAIALPGLPSGLSLSYVFSASPASSGTLFSVAATVALPSSTEPVVGSPSTFTILHTPSSSTMSCQTTGVAIFGFFLPGEGITCTITLQDSNGRTPTPTYDLQPVVTSGSVQGIAGTALITSATFTVVAPVGVGAITLSSRQFHVLASAQDQDFTTRVVYVPSNLTIASSTGTLVLVTRVLGNGNLVAGEGATLLFSGSGLSLTFAYTLSPFGSCNNSGTSVPAVTARGSTVAGDLALSFTTPPYAFYVCFQRSSLDTSHPLVQGAFTNITFAGAVGGLTDDDIILIVVACVLFCILLLLLPFVLWQLRSKPGPDPVLVYAPRVNDQYIHRPVVSTPIAQTPFAASTPRGSQHLSAPPPPGELRDDYGFPPIIVPQDETESVKGEKKKKKKKIDASLKKIAVMQQHELDARHSAHSSEQGGESPTMPPPIQPFDATNQYPQPVHIITVEERHQHSYTHGPSVLPVPPPGGDGFTPMSPYLTTSATTLGAGDHPQTTSARPFSVFGHTSQQFAAE